MNQNSRLDGETGRTGEADRTPTNGTEQADPFNHQGQPLCPSKSPQDLQKDVSSVSREESADGQYTYTERGKHSPNRYGGPLRMIRFTNADKDPSTTPDSKTMFANTNKGTKRTEQVKIKPLTDHANSDTNATFTALQTLLFKACMKGDVCGAAQALRLGADPSVDVLVINGWNRREGRLVHVPNQLLSALVAAGDVVLVSLLLSRGADPRRSGSGGATPLHALAASPLSTDTTTRLLPLLVQAGADTTAHDSRQRTPFHLAAASGNCAAMAALASLGEVPLGVDTSGNTPLHAAVASGREQAVAMVLDLYPGAVDGKNQAGETPLQLAATPEVVRLLLSAGAGLDTRTVEGLLKRVPAAVVFALDSCVTTNGEPLDSSQVEVLIDYAPFLGSSDHSTSEEDNLLHHIVSSGSQDELLKHPVVETFLHVKWRRLRHLFYINFIFYILFTLLLTEYCTSHQHGAWFRGVLATLTATIAARELFQLVHGGRLYVASLENWLELALIAMTTALLTGENMSVYTDEDVWRKHLTAWTLLVAWLELTLMLARFPTIGVYIYMVGQTARKLTLLLLIFSPLPFAFATGFHVLFHNHVPFHSLARSFLTTLIMAMGELNYGQFSEAATAWPVTSQLLLVLLVATLSIVTVNLLIGLSVADMADVSQRAGVQRLRHTALLLLHVQQALQSAPLQQLLPGRLLRCLRRQATILPLLQVRPDNIHAEYELVHSRFQNTNQSQSELKKKARYQAGYRPTQPSEKHTVFAVTASGQFNRTTLKTRASIQQNMLSLLKAREGETEHLRSSPLLRPRVLATSSYESVHVAANDRVQPTPRTSTSDDSSSISQSTWASARSTPPAPVPQSPPTSEQSVRRRKHSVCERDRWAAVSQTLSSVLTKLSELQLRADIVQRRLDENVSRSSRLQLI